MCSDKRYKSPGYNFANGEKISEKGRLQLEFKTKRGIELSGIFFTEKVIINVDLRTH